MFDFSKFSVFSSGSYQFEFYTNYPDGKCGVFRTSYYDIAVSTISSWSKRGIPFELKVLLLVDSYDIGYEQLSFI